MKTVIPSFFFFFAFAVKLPVIGLTLTQKAAQPDFQLD